MESERLVAEVLFTVSFAGDEIQGISWQSDDGSSRAGERPGTDRKGASAFEVRCRTGGFGQGRVTRQRWRAGCDA